MKFGVHRTVKLPVGAKFEMSEAFWRDIGKIAESSILQNIKEQRQSDGAALKRNRPTWAEFKRRLGLGTRALVAQRHRFVRGSEMSWSFGVLRDARGAIGMQIGHATQELWALSKSLQMRGYVGWLGLNQKAREAMILRLRVEMRRMIQAALKGKR